VYYEELKNLREMRKSRIRRMGAMSEICERIWSEYWKQKRDLVIGDTIILKWVLEI
jgi:hypothetical protein